MSGKIPIGETELVCIVYSTTYISYDGTTTVYASIKPYNCSSLDYYVERGLKPIPITYAQFKLFFPEGSNRHRWKITPRKPKIKIKR